MIMTFTIGLYNPPKKGIFPLKTKTVFKDSYRQAEEHVLKLNNRLKNKESYWKINTISS